MGWVANPDDASSSWTTGALWGAIAAAVMAVVMIAGVLTNVSPMPKPIPLAVAHLALGSTAPMAVLILAAVVGHLAYGAFWGGLLYALWRPVAGWKGLALGAGLWVLMGLAWLPLLGWGAFGTAVTPRIGVATLVLHLIFGAVLGYGPAPGSAAGGRQREVLG